MSRDEMQSDDVRVIAGQSGSRQVRWLTPAHIGSAAFWIDQTQRSSFPTTPRMGNDLLEETAACMLGGFGITGAMTLAAFEGLRTAGLLEPGVSAGQIESVLSRPLLMPDGGMRRYRFARQRADRLSSAFQTLADDPPSESLSGRELRNWLMRLPGVGLKTASWIARNFTAAEDIAVVDIHVLRAGQVAGIFDDRWKVDRDYPDLEDFFCAWAAEGRVHTSNLDLCIWSQLAGAARLGVRLDVGGVDSGILTV